MRDIVIIGICFILYMHGNEYDALLDRVDQLEQEKTTAEQVVVEQDSIIGMYENHVTRMQIIMGMEPDGEISYRDKLSVPQSYITNLLNHRDGKKVQTVNAPRESVGETGLVESYGSKLE